MIAITRSWYERKVLRVETTRLNDLRHLLARSGRTNGLHRDPKPGYTSLSPDSTLSHNPAVQPSTST